VISERRRGEKGIKSFVIFFSFCAHNDYQLVDMLSIWNNRVIFLLMKKKIQQEAVRE
jgi:hypothetical protein